MANRLIPNPRKRSRSFFQQLAQPEEDEGFFGLGRYQPLAEFETPGQQPLIRAPRMRQPEQRIPIPDQVIVPDGGIPGVSTGTFTGRPIRAYGETLINGGDVPGARTDTFAGQPIRVPYSEQYRREHPKPKLAPAPGLSKKRRIGAAIATFAAELGRPGAGYEVGQQILYGPREREEREHERGLEAWQQGLEEARERDIGEGRRIQRELGQERLTRLRQTPMPTAGETEPEAFERKLKEAEGLGLKEGTPQFLEYVSGRDLGPGGEIGLFLQDPQAYERMLSARGRHRVDRRTATEIQIALYEKDLELYQQIFDRVGIRSEQQLRLRMAEAAMRLAETVTGQVDPELFAQKLAELSSIVGLELENQGQPEAGRTATRQEVEAFAQSKGISYEEAEQQYKAAGYTIQ